MAKCTDRPLIYNIFERAGDEHISHIPEILYNYREHENNSYKTVSVKLKTETLDYIVSLPRHIKIIENIHIVMCCWKRTDNLFEQLTNINEQTYSYRIILHLLNNNPDEKNNLINIVKKINLREKPKIKIILSHYNNEFYGFQRFLYIKNLIKNNILDYVLMIDDDQLYEKYWVEKYVEFKRAYDI